MKISQQSKKYICAIKPSQSVEILSIIILVTVHTEK